MTAEGLLGGLARAAAFAGIVAVLVAALAGLRATRLAAFGAPVAWGLIGVWAAERAAKADVAALALGAAVLVAAMRLGNCARQDAVGESPSTALRAVPLPLWGRRTRGR